VPTEDGDSQEGKDEGEGRVRGLRAAPITRLTLTQYNVSVYQVSDHPVPIIARGPRLTAPTLPGRARGHAGAGEGGEDRTREPAYPGDMRGEMEGEGGATRGLRAATSKRHTLP
jgi:hypothetical protein